MTAPSSRLEPAATRPSGALRVISPAPRAAWRRAWQSDPDALATQSPEWVDAVCSTGAYRDSSRCYELPGGRTLILPLVSRRWGGLALTAASFPPGWGYGGLLADGSPTAEDLRLVLADLGRRPVARITVVPRPQAAAQWVDAAPPRARRAAHLTHILDLRAGWDEVWKGYRPKVRESVRRAQRAGLDVQRRHGPDALPVFAELYRLSVAHWAGQRGRPGWIARLAARHEDTTGRLAAVARRLGDACTIWTAHLDGAPVAASVTLDSPGHSIGWVSAMDRDLVRRTRASYLLESAAIEHAARRGARFFHLGESDPGSGVAKHKVQYGAGELGYESVMLERLPLFRAEQTIRSAVHSFADRGAKPPASP